ncbi:hypothetical protein QVD17_23818 [Tagetes erecta]|uniref:P-type ATPase A domain-containing protein n=1 Tax=Tagetes erecta TaxID=13708 RepID=A0AAD8KKW1_TARER|nr:hypothetical protein QVD17_23818 [Tagetes erecta]
MEEVNDGMDLEMQLRSSPPTEDHGGDSGSAIQIMQTAILVIRSVQVFLAGSSSKSMDTSPDQQLARDEDVEEVVVEGVNADQTAPLLQTVDNTLHSRQPIRRLVHVLHSILAFKAHKASKPEVDETNDSSATSYDHLINPITSNQTQSSPREIISSIVRQKNHVGLIEFGGLPGVEVALRTNSDDGISENEALNRKGQHDFSLSVAPAHTFFHLVWEEVKRKTILLLLLCVVLSTLLQINQEGLEYGCYDGVVVLVAVILLVFFVSVRKYWEEKRAQKKLQFIERKEGKVHVKRGGVSRVICESELVWGDILLLKKGDEIPCDGLFVGDEPLELDRDCGSDSCIVNQQEPFLSYGERVINGEARMLVTSTNTSTGWSEMMSKAIGDTNTRFKLETHIDKLNTYMHYIQMVISVIIILVLMFRIKVGKIDEDNAYRPESMAEPTVLRSFASTFKRMIKESRFTIKALTKLLSVSLVGLTGGVPFVVSLAIVYWNNKTLFGKAAEQDPHGVAKMAHVTRICTDAFITENGMEVEILIIGGEQISGRPLPTLSPVVNEALCGGIGTLKQTPFSRVKNNFGLESEKRWKIIEIKGASLFEEPCGVLMNEGEEMVWHFNGPVNKILNMCKHYYDIEGHKLSTLGW